MEHTNFNETVSSMLLNQMPILLLVVYASLDFQSFSDFEK